MKTLIKSDTKQSYQGTPLVNKYGDNDVAFLNKFDLYTVMDDSGNFYTIDQTLAAAGADISEPLFTPAAICIGQHPTSGKSLFIPLGNLITIPDGKTRNINAEMYIINASQIDEITIDEVTTNSTTVKALYNGAESTAHWLSLMETANVLDSFDVYKYINDFGTSDDNLTPYTSGWYLPSVGELLMISDIWSDLNNYLVQINENYKINDYFWSSNFYSSSLCWYVHLISDNLGYVYDAYVYASTRAVLPYLAI